MANSKITAFESLVSVSDNDVVAIVDVSDTTQAASGTTKKVTRSNLLGSDVVRTEESQTIKNKELEDDSTVFFNTSSTTKRFEFNAANISVGATRQYTMPNANTDLVGHDTAQTLTNKDLSSATNTFPANLATLSGTQTFTGEKTFTELLNIAGNSSSSGEVRIFEDTDNGTNYASIKAPSTLAANYTLTLPADDGTADQILKTDGSGNLSWTSSTTFNGGTITSPILFGNGTQKGAFGAGAGEIPAIPVRNTSASNKQAAVFIQFPIPFASGGSLSYSFSSENVFDAGGNTDRAAGATKSTTTVTDADGNHVGFVRVYQDNSNFTDGEAVHVSFGGHAQGVNTKMSVEEFFTHNATYIVTTIGTVMTAFGLVQYRTGQLEQRMNKIAETFENHVKDSDTKYVRQDTFSTLVSRLDRMENKIDMLITKQIKE